jgi:hypothetical protein
VFDRPITSPARARKSWGAWKLRVLALFGFMIFDLMWIGCSDFSAPPPARMGERLTGLGCYRHGF